MKSLTLDEIKQIPELSKTMTVPQVADKLGVHERTINGWSRRLRAQGVEVYFKRGRRPINLNQI